MTFTIVICIIIAVTWVLFISMMILYEKDLNEVRAKYLEAILFYKKYRRKYNDLAIEMEQVKFENIALTYRKEKNASKQSKQKNSSKTNKKL